MWKRNTEKVTKIIKREEGTVIKGKSRIEDMKEIRAPKIKGKTDKKVNKKAIRRKT